MYMTNETYEALLLELRKIPELKAAEISFLPAKTRGKHVLAAVKFEESDCSCFDDWVIHFIAPVYSRKIRPLLQKYGISGKIRFLFYRENEMVYYTYIATTVFHEMPDAPRGDWFGDHSFGFKFIAEHADVDAVIGYLTQLRSKWI